MSRRKVVILGSTGSIGTQALDIIRANPALFEVVGLAAGQNARLLSAQAAEFGVQATALAANDPVAVAELAAMECDVVLNGITGAIGLGPTLAALEAGNTVALANKESLVVGGPLVKALAKPGQLVPVDSEHSAIAQALRSGTHREVRRLILTASGGPFRGRKREDLHQVTLEQALAHPTWNMGQVVTINSATMVNKALEMIEAHLLFDIPMEQIAVTVHPQSVVHSMVEFVDGSVLAQASPPDMRLPIALGLSWPDRVRDAATPCDWSKSATWEFFPPDEEAFPALKLARIAGAAGGSAPAALNAANEVAVAAFAAGRLSFLGIVDTVERVLLDHLAAGHQSELDLAQLLTVIGKVEAQTRVLIEG